MSKLKDSKHLTIKFEAIKEATKNFQDCIGQGGYGLVYKGELSISGQVTTVAVKRLNEKFGQGLKEFLTEIELLKGQQHKNLISLLGYCDEGKEKIIVYEYAQHGSLDQHLIRKNDTSYSLTWLGRLRICVDVARGLDHLHNHAGKHQAIIHRDIKSSNVLLDHNWVAKISDLGLSKLSLAGLDRSAVISLACGTPGYIEPEYRFTGILKKESDVYSFGMVLLEILCGRLCTIRDARGFFLSHYYERKKLHTVVDPTLRQQMSSDSVNRFLAIAYGCLHQDRRRRYPMDRIVKELEQLLKIEISEDGNKSDLISSDELQGWISEFSFTDLVTHRTNVGKLFDIFDLNRDGGLSRKELAAFLFAAKHVEEQLSTRVDEIFNSYDKYVDGKKGLTYHGLLQYYADGHNNLESDIERVMSDSDDSSTQKKSTSLVQKSIISNKDAGDVGLNREEIAAHKSLHEKIGGLPIKLFHWFLKFMDDKRSLTYDSQLKMDDVSDGGDQLDSDNEAAFWFSSPESSDKSLMNRAKLFILIALLTLSISAILVKLKYMWFLLVILAHYVYAFMNKRKKMR